jgi:hypothetical protein
MKRVLFSISILALGVFLAGHNFSHTPVLHRAVKESASEENTAAKQYYDWLKLHDPATGEIPFDIRRRELAFSHKLDQRAASFKSASPSSTLAVGTDWISRGPNNVGGRTLDIALDRDDESIILAASAQGGVWRSIDTGHSWTATTAPDQLHDATCLAQDIRANHHNIWYYGTGELLSTTWRRASIVSPPRWRTRDLGNGIYRSSNQGVTWTPLPSTVTKKPNDLDHAFDGVWNIVLDPNTAQDIIYAACYTGIMRSSDGGTSWTRVLGDTTYRSFCSDLVMTTNGVLYAALSSYTLDGGSSISAGIWRSTDGLTWKAITPTTGWPAQTNRMRLALAPSDQNIVYAFMETPGTNQTGHSFWKYKYLSGTGVGLGGRWENRSQSLPYDPTNPSGGYSTNTLGGYALMVSVKPSDTNAVFLGGTNLYRSTDGFNTSNHTSWIGGYGPNSFYPGHHPDNHVLIFSPSNPNAMYSGTDGGIFETDNNVDSVIWENLNSGYHSTLFVSVALDHMATGDPLLLGGLQDNGSYTTNGSDTPWDMVGGGDGCYSAIGGNEHALYSASQFGNVSRFGYDAQFNPTSYADVTPIDNTNDFSVFVAPFALDRTNTKVMYLASGHFIWRNSDLTAIPNNNNQNTSLNWDKLLSTEIVDTSVISAVAVSTLPSHRLYYATSQSKIFRVDDAHVGDPMPREISSPLFPPNAFISCIAVDPRDAEQIIAVFSNYSVQSIFASSDGGASWRNISGNIEENPDGSGNGPSCRWVSILHNGAKTFYYLGTTIGLFSTTDISGASTTWTREGASTIGTITVEMIDARESDGVVAVATQGKGVYSSVVTLGVASPNAPASEFDLGLTNYPNPVYSSTTIQFELPKQEFAALELFDPAGRMIATLANESLSAGKHSFDWTPGKLPSQTILYRLITPEGVITKRMQVLH